MIGTIKAFNKIIKHDLTKVWKVNRGDWDLKIPTVLWAYRTTYKKLTRYTPFRLVYGQEAIIPSPRITAFTDMYDIGAIEERLL